MNQPPFPNFQDYPADAPPNGSLGGQMLGALHDIRTRLARIRSGMRIVQEVPSDVGGTASGNFVIGNTRGAYGSAGWTATASVKGQVAAYRTAFVQTPFVTLYGPIDDGVKLGVIAKVRYSVQDNAQYEFIIDVPPNAIVHAPCLSQNMSVECMVTQVVFSEAELVALPAGWFDNPLAVKINHTHSVNADGQPISTVPVRVAITSDQGLASNFSNGPARQISVVLASNGSAVIPIPHGAVTCTFSGPADLIASFSLEAPWNSVQTLPFGFILPTILPSGVESISVSSVTGGLTSVNFTLGF